MSRQAIEILRRATEAFNRGDLDAWEECFDPDVIYYDQSNVDTPAVITGRSQVR